MEVDALLLLTRTRFLHYNYNELVPFAKRSSQFVISQHICYLDQVQMYHRCNPILQIMSTIEKGDEWGLRIVVINQVNDRKTSKQKW